MRIRFGAASLAILLSVAPSLAAGEFDWDEAEIWALNHKEEIQEILFPLAPLTGKDVPRGMGDWMLRARIEMSQSAPEALLSLERRGSSEEVTLTTIEPASTSILDQTAAIHRKDPTATPQSVAERLQLHRITRSSGSCAILTKLADEFEGMKIHPVQSSRVVIHGVAYEVVVYSGNGSMLRASLYGLGGPSKEREPLVAFLVKLRAEVNRKCAGTEAP